LRKEDHRRRFGLLAVVWAVNVIGSGGFPRFVGKSMSLPSLFDIQINGFAGVDFQRIDLTQKDLRHAIGVLRAHQTHRIFLTLITDEVDALCVKFERIETFRRADSGDW
jgi:N-acetylglucosamine-6-phosphate deacetylase